MDTKLHLPSYHQATITDIESARQREEGRRLLRQEMKEEGSTLSQPTKRGERLRCPSKLGRRQSEAPTGHQAFLKMLEGSKAIIECKRMYTGEKVRGVIRASDNYTISLDTDSGVRVLFKHSLAEFSPISPKLSKDEAAK